MNDSPSLFDDFDVIHTYSRSQAIEDGVLVDVSETAKELGIRYPVALTVKLWETYIVPPQSSKLHCQSIEGRLWDTLWLFTWAAKGSSGDVLVYDCNYAMDSKHIETVKIKAVCGPGDTPEPVITIMLPDED